MPSRSTSTQTVVTGGAGFIGSHLCDALLARGQHVTCVDSLVGTGDTTRNVAHLLGHPRFRLLVEDVLDWAERADLGGVDCVFHLAASKNSVCMADPERDLAVNALATLRLLRAAGRDGVRKLVHASTGSVFGEANRRHAEDAPTRPVSYYGVSKLAGESYCRASDVQLSPSITRPAPPRTRARSTRSSASTTRSRRGRRPRWSSR